MGGEVVPGAAGAVAEREGDGLTEPTFWGVLMTGLPGFLREGFLPLGRVLRRARAARARGRDRRLGARLGPDLRLRAAGGPRRSARPALARLRRRPVGRSGSLRTARPSTSPSRCWSRPRGGSRSWSRSRSAGRWRVRSPTRGTRSRRWLRATARLQARLRRRVGRLGRVLPRAAARCGSRSCSTVGHRRASSWSTFVTGTPVMLLLLAWSMRYSMRRLADVEPPA